MPRDGGLDDSTSDHYDGNTRSMERRPEGDTGRINLRRNNQTAGTMPRGATHEDNNRLLDKASEINLIFNFSYRLAEL